MNLPAHIAAKWPALVRIGRISMQAPKQAGRPRVYSDEQRKQRERERDARRRAA